MKVRGGVVLAGPILFLLVVVSTATQKPTTLASAKRKIDHLEANAKSKHPDPKPTILTEAEINAYLASDDVQMPKGVRSVTLRGETGAVTGDARVDFDQVREGIHSSNPLLAIFSGVHDVEVGTHAYGKGGTGYVHVDSVLLDGIEVPHFVLELFVEKYLTPKYPEIGMDSKFQLPDRIDSAAVGQSEVTLVQK